MKINKTTAQDPGSTPGRQRFTFDPGNSGFLMALLSRDLYKHSEFAVLRELFSNGIDACRAAGVEEMVYITVTPYNHEGEDRMKISVMDKGTGMDEDHIVNVFTVFLSSDRNTDDSFIGGFGLGSKSPFAVADEFNVLTTKKGHTTEWYVGKGYDSVPFMEKIADYSDNETENGTTVTIDVKIEGYSNRQYWRQAFHTIYVYNRSRITLDINMTGIAGYEPVNIDYYFNLLTEEMDKVEVRDFGNFRLLGKFRRDMLSFMEHPHAVIDGIPYPIDMTMLSIDELPITRKLTNYLQGLDLPIAIEVSNSEVKPMATREQLVYDPISCIVLAKRLIATFREVARISMGSEEETDNFLTWMKAHSKDKTFEGYNINGLYRALPELFPSPCSWTPMNEITSSVKDLTPVEVLSMFKISDKITSTRLSTVGKLLVYSYFDTHMEDYDSIADSPYYYIEQSNTSSYKNMWLVDEWEHVNSSPQLVRKVDKDRIISSMGVQQDWYEEHEADLQKVQQMFIDQFKTYEDVEVPVSYINSMKNVRAKSQSSTVRQGEIGLYIFRPKESGAGWTSVDVTSFDPDFDKADKLTIYANKESKKFMEVIADLTDNELQFALVAKSYMHYLEDRDDFQSIFDFLKDPEGKFARVMNLRYINERLIGASGTVKYLGHSSDDARSYLHDASFNDVMTKVDQRLGTTMNGIMKVCETLKANHHLHFRLGGWYRSGTHTRSAWGHVWDNIYKLHGNKLVLEETVKACNDLMAVIEEIFPVWAYLDDRAFMDGAPELFAKMLCDYTNIKEVVDGF